MPEYYADYAWNGPTPQQLKAAGVKGVLRYLQSQPTPSGAELTAAERDALWTEGLGIALLYETSADLLDHPERAAAAAQQANASADALGAPLGVPVFFCSDETSANLSATVSSMQTIVATCTRPVGFYGSEAACEAVHAAVPQVRWFFKVETWGPTTDLDDIIQLANSNPVGLANVDSDLVVHPIPLWVGPGQVTGAVPQENDMEFIKLKNLDGSFQYAVLGGGKAVVLEGPPDPDAFGIPKEMSDLMALGNSDLPPAREVTQKVWAAFTAEPTTVSTQVVPTFTVTSTVKAA